MRTEHKQIQRKLLDAWKLMRKHKPRNDTERILFLLCEAAWDLVESMRVLAERKHGASAMILCRSMLEWSAAADVLAEAKDDQTVKNYIDFGKTVIYEVGEARGESQKWLQPQRQDYETIKTRLGKKKWHGSTKIEDLINKSRFRVLGQSNEPGLYKTFYKEASAISHGDSYMFLHGAKGRRWQLCFDSKEMENWATVALSTGYQLMAATLCTVQTRCGLDLEDTFEQMADSLQALPQFGQ